MPAAPEQIPTDLTLEIGDSLSPSRFMAVARAFFGYVEAISESIMPEGESLHWLVRVREGSSLLAVDPTPSAPVEFVNQIYSRAERGVKRLIEKNLEDSGLNEAALGHLRVLAEMTIEGPKRASAPVKMRLWIQRKPLGLDPTIANTIREQGDGHFSDHGSIEGRLIAIQEAAGSLQFYINDAILHQKVKCNFPERLLNDVFSKFRRRIEVYGLVSYRKRNVPVSIEADKIIELPDDSELPSIDEVIGILRSQ